MTSEQPLGVTETHPSDRSPIFTIIIINIQPTVKVPCPVGYVMLSSRVELQPLTLVYMGFSGSYLTVNFFRIQCILPAYVRRQIKSQQVSNFNRQYAPLPRKRKYILIKVSKIQSNLTRGQLLLKSVP